MRYAWTCALTMGKCGLLVLMIKSMPFPSGYDREWTFILGKVYASSMPIHVNPSEGCPKLISVIWEMT